jgi:RNA polymerase sigma factor (sigma-70 family)
MRAFADILPRIRPTRETHAGRSMETAATLTEHFENVDDVELLSRIGRDDAAAYRALSERYLLRVVRFSARLLGDATEAEDVAQETFLRVWREASRFEPRAKPSTWIYRIAHNLCVDRLRKRREVGADTDVPARISSGDRPNDLLARKEVAEQVARALAALPERQRAALALVHYEGLGNIEAAQVLELSVEALESLLGRGRRSLREALAGLRTEGDGT